MLEHQLVHAEKTSDKFTAFEDGRVQAKRMSLRIQTAGTSWMFEHI